MRTLYIGGQTKKKNGGTRWKLYLFLVLFLGIVGTGLKLSAPIIVERWINELGASATGYAFSIRDVDLSLEKGQMVLRDMKVFNPENQAELLETPTLTVHLDWQELLLGQEKKIIVVADKVDLILSKDFSSELKRIKAAGEKQPHDFYLNIVEGKIARLNVIEQKENHSRTVLELSAVNVKVKEVTPLSINRKTEFSITSKIANGGSLNLSGKTREEEGRTPWSIQGSLKAVPADLFNHISGVKLPFSFNEPKLNAEISASSDRGKVTGEIVPEVKLLNLLVEKPGLPTQSIARALTDELTFTLPFTLKDGLTFQYEDTFKRLKSYRKYPGTLEAQVSQISAF